MTYSTPDLPTAAALLLFHQKIIRVDRSTPRKTVFVFERTPELEEKLGMLGMDALAVSPRSYSKALRHLKNLIHNKKL